MFLALVLAITAAVLGVSWLVLGRHRLAAALQTAEHQYRQLFHDSPQPMYVYDIDTGRLLGANAAALARYGYSENEFLALTTDDLRARGGPATPPATEGAAPAGATRHRTKDGRTIDVQIDSSVIQWVGRPARLDLVHDVTERMQLKEQLSQSQKMEAIGQLAGGVAHDFNNLLTTIQGYTDLLLTQIGPDKSMWKDLHEIQAASARAALLTHQLLAFSRRQQFDIVAVDVNDVVTRLSQMMRRLIPEDIELDVSLGAGPLHVKADASRLEQVLINLVVNARDAVSGPGGRIHIRTARGGAAGLGADGGSYVALEVIDNGSGMDESTRRRVFEPFFTTKEPGAGTGLGLAMVYGIVQQCGGHVDVDSAPGRGSTFRVLLRWTSDPVRTATRAGDMHEAFIGAERILVVEDSTELRLLVAQVLKRHGYQVLEAAMPEDALAFTHRAEGPVDVVLMDVVMPRMAGPEVAGHLKAAWPGAAVLYMSGYDQDALVKRGILVDHDVLLKKPFTPADLLRRIRNLIDHPIPELS